MLSFKTHSRTHYFKCLATDDLHLGRCGDNISSARGHLNFLYVNRTARTCWRAEMFIFLKKIRILCENGRMYTRINHYKVYSHWLFAFLSVLFIGCKCALHHFCSRARLVGSKVNSLILRLLRQNGRGIFHNITLSIRLVSYKLYVNELLNHAGSLAQW